MTKHLFILNQNKLKLAAVIEFPNTNQQYPFVLILHGFKGYKEEETYTELAKELLKNNIGSIRFDASGFGESEGSLMKDYRFSNYVKDVEAVYDYLVKQPFVDRNHIAVAGQSMGGMQSIVFAANHPEIQTAVAISPPDQMLTVDDLSKHLPDWKKTGILKITSSKYGEIKLPYDFVIGAKKWDMTKIISKISQPILFMLGLADSTVLPEQTRRIYQAAHQPKQLVELKGMDHFYKNDPEMLKKINEIVCEYINANI